MERANVDGTTVTGIGLSLYVDGSALFSSGLHTQFFIDTPEVVIFSDTSLASVVLRFDYSADKVTAHALGHRAVPHPAGCRWPSSRDVVSLIAMGSVSRPGPDPNTP